MVEPGRSTGGTRFALHAGRTVAAMVSATILSVTAYGWANFGDVNEGIVTTDVISPKVVQAGPKPLDGAVDILLVGLDSRTDAYGNPLPREVLDMLHAGVSDGERNTDTMILLHIPVDGRRAVAFSFPRDSYVEIAGGYGKHKLNSAFVYAFNNAMKKTAKGVPQKQAEEAAKVEGRKNLIATIETLVGNAVSIDRYAEVNLASFYEITKAVGGVEVCLNGAVDEWRSGAKFPAGKQTISGAQALSFVRQRYELPNGDLDRIVRQQVFIGALAHKVLSTGTLSDMGKLSELVSAVKKSVVLSTGWDITTFAQQMQGLSSGAIDFRTIPNQGPAKIGGADVVKVDPAEVQAFVGALTKDERSPSASSGPSTAPSFSSQSPPPPSTSTKSITVDVRNASSEAGLAAAVRNILAGKGFLPGAIGDTAAQAKSTIRHRPGEEAGARLVTAELGGQFTFVPDTTLASGQVRAILGQDYPETLGKRLSGSETSGRTSPNAVGAQPSTTTPKPGGQSAPPTTPVSADGVSCVN